MRLLIVEDGKELADGIVEYLQKEGYVCDAASNVNDAIERIALYNYDCILLDIMLPDGSGFTVLDRLKKDGKMDGVIIISAKDSIDDRISGLKLGADDYLIKPFHMAELGARLEALLRRKNFHGSNKIVFEELVVDVPAQIVKVKENPVPLTRKEYDLLLFLISNKGRVVSKNAIAEHLSGDMADMLDDYGFVYAHVKNLKKKLSDVGCRDFIKTVYGFGYKWEA